MNRETQFSGPFSSELAELAGVVRELSETHGTSFVKAGDNRVYAWGGDGYVVVMDESMWEGTVEVTTPKASLTIKPSESGHSVVSGTDDEKTIRQHLRDAAAGLKNYYESKYWKSPGLAR